ncbi:MAG TPA: hypothetical protein VM791_18335, partial [Vicinamibacterales bacterium]|nr:hypothetical protein [Vicinamibacterales bacterium]
MHAGKHPHHSRSQRKPCCASEQREDDALDEHLPDEPRPLGTECGTNREFAAAHGRFREQEIRNVGERDQQNECDRADEDHQRHPHVAGHQVANGDRCAITAVVALVGNEP